YTSAWLLYLGLFFIMTILFAPSGLAGLIMMHGPIIHTKAFWRVLRAYAIGLVPALAVGVRRVLIIQLNYRVSTYRVTDNLIATNGAGKSTLFNLISGRFAPTSGSIVLCGEAISAHAPHEINRRGLARSFQITNIFPRLSVYENIRCSVLWSLGYKYCFWRGVDKLRDAGERTERIL